MVQVISNPSLCDLSPTYSEQLESATSRLMLANAQKKQKKPRCVQNQHFIPALDMEEDP